jgi:hypothetical protein
LFGSIQRPANNIPRQAALFFAWMAPAVLFFIVVFIPPYKYSYGLVLLPAFWVLTPVAVRQVLAEIKTLPLAMTAGVRQSQWFIFFVGYHGFKSCGFLFQ